MDSRWEIYNSGGHLWSLVWIVTSPIKNKKLPFDYNCHVHNGAPACRIPLRCCCGDDFRTLDEDQIMALISSWKLKVGNILFSFWEFFFCSLWTFFVWIPIERWLLSKKLFLILIFWPAVLFFNLVARPTTLQQQQRWCWLWCPLDAAWWRNVMMPWDGWWNVVVVWCVVVRSEFILPAVVVACLWKQEHRKLFIDTSHF